MKTKRQNFPGIDKELVAVLRETFGDDEQLLTEAINEVRRAYAYIRNDEARQAEFESCDHLAC
jgi:hypothetical protein